jgi:hypothetical protein
MPLAAQQHSTWIQLACSILLVHGHAITDSILTRLIQSLYLGPSLALRSVPALPLRYPPAASPLCALLDSPWSHNLVARSAVRTWPPHTSAMAIPAHQHQLAREVSASGGSLDWHEHSRAIFRKLEVDLVQTRHLCPIHWYRLQVLGQQ